MLREQSLTNASPTEDVPRARPRLQPRCSGHKVEEEKKELEKRTPSSIPPLRGRVRTRPKFCCLGFCACFFSVSFPRRRGMWGFCCRCPPAERGWDNPAPNRCGLPGGGGTEKGWGGGGESQRGDLERSTAPTPKGCEAFHSPLLFLKGGGRKHKPCSQSSSFESSPASSPQAAELQPACAYIFIYIRASVRAASRDGLMGSGSSAGRPRPPRTAPRGRSASAPRCAPLRRSFWRGAKRGERHKREGRRESPSHAPLPQVYDGGPEE